ncbi:porin, partial [Bacillus safensis]|nr:porin [Bacillus safensis]
GYLGDIINDDVVAAGVYRTNLISYTFTGGNGFSAILSLEQGGDAYINHDDFIDEEDRLVSNRIDDYMPHVVGGLKFAQGWG